MHIADTKDTSAKDLAATAAPKDGDEVPTGNEAAEPSPRPSSPDGLPPPYTPSPHRSHIPTSRRGPPCTCSRHHDRGGGQARANPSNPEREGINWKAVGGTALAAVAVPTLAVAGAAIALPVIGFASSGVVSGSIAAGIQSSVYGGFTCGVFSMLQSIGATIVAPSVISTVTAAGAATAGTGIAICTGSQKSDGNRGDANGAAAGGQNAARVECSCADCECDENCECACRRQRRRG